MKPLFLASMIAVSALTVSAETGTTGPRTTPLAAAPAGDFAATKAGLLREMDDAQVLLNGNGALADQLALRYRPRLEDLRASVTDCQSGVELERFDRSFREWKTAVYRETFVAARAVSPRLTYERFSRGLDESVAFLAAGRRDLARRREVQQFVDAQALTFYAAAHDPAMTFDNAAARGGAVQPAAFRGLADARREPDAAPRRISPDEADAPPAPPAATPGAFAQFIASVASVPRAWAKSASEYATQVSNAIFNYAAGVQKTLLAGLLQAESGFNSVVGSWAGCLGLGQLSSGIASHYGVADRTNIAQNVRGSAAFLRDLQKHYSNAGEAERLQRLYAEAAAYYDEKIRAFGPRPTKKQKDAVLSAAYGRIASRIPYGIQNSLAAYNAGQPAVDRYHGWSHLPLPEGGCVDRPAQDNSYCQTMAYVPRVLRNSLGVYINTREEAPAQTVSSL